MPPTRAAHPIPIPAPAPAESPPPPEGVDVVVDVEVEVGPVEEAVVADLVVVAELEKVEEDKDAAVAAASTAEVSTFQYVGCASVPLFASDAGVMSPLAGSMKKPFPSLQHAVAPVPQQKMLRPQSVRRVPARGKVSAHICEHFFQSLSAQYCRVEVPAVFAQRRFVPHFSSDKQHVFVLFPQETSSGPT